MKMIEKEGGKSSDGKERRQSRDWVMVLSKDTGDGVNVLCKDQGGKNGEKLRLAQIL